MLSRRGLFAQCVDGEKYPIVVDAWEEFGVGIQQCSGYQLICLTNGCLLTEHQVSTYVQALSWLYLLQEASQERGYTWSFPKEFFDHLSQQERTERCSLLLRTRTVALRENPL